MDNCVIRVSDADYSETMIKFRYKRKESSDGGKSGTAIQKQKIEGLRDRELLPPKDMLLTGSLAGVRNNTLPRSRPSSAARREPPESPLSQTTISLFRVSLARHKHFIISKECNIKFSQPFVYKNLGSYVFLNSYKKIFLYDSIQRRVILIHHIFTTT